MKHARTLLLAVGALAIAALAWHHMTILGDGFWMLATGDAIRARGALPTTDPFSFASDGRHWTLVSIASSLAYSAVASRFGLLALLAVGTALETLAVVLLWRGSARTFAGRALLFVPALFFVQVDAEDISVRGQLFGDVAFVLLLAAMARLRDGKKVPALLVVLGVALWRNVHPSFVLALLVPVAVAALALLDAPEERPRLRPFLVFTGLALVGSCLGPYGPGYLRLALGFGLSGSTGSFDLFRSPSFLEPAWLVAPAAGLVLAVVRGRLGPARARRAEQALLVAFVLAACKSRRYATELVAVEIALVGPLLDAAWPVVRARLEALGLALVAAVAASGALLVAREPKDPLRDVPVESAVVAREAERQSREAGRPFTNVIDPLHWGGYLAWAWQGNPRYFVDGRDHLVLFGNGVVDDAEILWQGQERWDEILDVYEGGVVLWERGAALDVLLRRSPKWRLIHEDALAVVYVRAPRPRELVPAPAPAP